MAGTTTKGQPTKRVIESVNPIIKNGEHHKDKLGNFNFVVKFQGEEIGYTISAKDKEAATWPVGKEVEYIPSTWTADDGSFTMHRASLVKTDSPYQNKRPFTPKGIKQYQAEAIMTAANATANIILVKDSVPAEEFGKWFKAVYNAMNTELKAIFSE